MNLNLKAVYFCATNAHRWGRGLTITDAKKNAGLHTKTDEKRVQFYVQAAIFNDPTKDELGNLAKCIVGDSIDGSAKYYDQDRTEGDSKMINEKHVGWLMVEKNF